jgi:hypothetical protein
VDPVLGLLADPATPLLGGLLAGVLLLLASRI